MTTEEIVILSLTFIVPVLGANAYFVHKGKKAERPRETYFEVSDGLISQILDSGGGKISEIEKNKIVEMIREHANLAYMGGKYGEDRYDVIDELTITVVFGLESLNYKLPTGFIKATSNVFGAFWLLGFGEAHRER